MPMYATEVTDFAPTRVNIGLNDWDFAWRLDPRQSFMTPSSYGGYTTEGFGAASRCLHDFTRDLVVPHAGEPRKVLYNSWEATAFNIDAQSQLALAQRAAEIGVELFVMDDGWFHGRTTDNAGLGDWWPDEKKFPDGLAPLIKGVNELGMDFGLWSEPGWLDAPGDARELWVRYVEGLYLVWDTLRALHPSVIWQSCSGGGGRADQIWVSDNTEATARLAIQEGFSHIFPSSTMEAWVTDAARDRVPLQFRFHVSMCGVLGIGAQILRWSEQESAEARRLIAQYKEIRPIVQFGDLYRLRSPQRHPFSAVQYVSKDRAESALFAFRTLIPDPVELPPLHLRGLDPTVRSTVTGFESPRSGQAWMHAGLQVSLNNFQSALLRIRRV